MKGEVFYPIDIGTASDSVARDDVPASSIRDLLISQMEVT